MMALLTLDTLRTIAEVIGWWTACGLLACLVWIAERRRERVRTERVSRRRAGLIAGTIACLHPHDVLLTDPINPMAWRCVDCGRVLLLGWSWYGASNRITRRSA